MRIYSSIRLLLYFLIISTQLHAALTIRDYNPLNDLNPVNAICAQNWENLGEEDPSCAVDFQKALYVLSLMRSQSNSLLKALVAQENEQIIGFALYGGPIHIDEVPQKIKDQQEECPMAELTHIAVDQNAQRKGIGSQLFNTLINDLKNKKFKGIYSRVKADNKQAFNWHIKQGFHIVTQRNTTNQAEEYQRAEAESGGYRLLVLRFDKIRLIKKGHNQSKLSADLYAKLKHDAHNNQAHNKHQSEFMHDMVKKIKSFALVSKDNWTRIMRFYLRVWPNKEKTGKFASMLLGKDYDSFKESAHTIITHIEKLYQQTLRERQERETREL